MAPRLALVTVLLLVELIGPARLQRASAALHDLARSGQAAGLPMPGR
jgi:hypothetical protein